MSNCHDAADSSARAVRSRWWFWLAGYTPLILLTGTNLPTPLYQGYEERFGFSPFVATLIFAAYIAALIPTLLIAGPASDVIGRRTVLVPAVLLAIAGSVLFVFASGIAWLFAARIVQGLALGAASGALTAALTELEPGGDRRRAALVATVASVGGLGLGPLLGGLLAQYAPLPRVTPFVVEIVLLVPALAAVAAMPIRRPVGPGMSRTWRPRRPRISVEMRALFATGGSANFLAFAVIGLFLSLIPAYTKVVAHSANLFLGGGIAALLLAASASVQLVGYGWAPRRLLGAGVLLLAVGLGLIGLVGVVTSLAILLAATVFAGAGHGAVFLGGLTEIADAAPEGVRAEVISAFYVTAYAGVGVPVLGLGVAATVTDLATAVSWFAVAVAILCLVVLGLLVFRHRGAVHERTPVEAEGRHRGIMCATSPAGGRSVAISPTKSDAYHDC